MQLESEHNHRGKQFMLMGQDRFGGFDENAHGPCSLSSVLMYHLPPDGELALQLVYHYAGSSSHAPCILAAANELWSSRC